jgi:UDP-N-acetylmuramate--alanine ligase
VVRELSGRHDTIRYGLAEGADVRAVDLRPSGGAFCFTVECHGQAVAEVTLPLRGVHNVVNATGVFALATAIGVDPDTVVAALERFGGVARRFDIRGVDDGATFVDDYAHLPSEIAAVLAAARGSGDGWERVVAVFQPNRYHRIAEMWADYHSAFVDADVVVITDVYASGTIPIPGVTGKLIVNAVLDAHPRSRVIWIPRRDDLIRFLAREVRPGDVCISMGCGDVASLPDEVLSERRSTSVTGVLQP